MSLLAPWFLAGLVAIGVPIAVHLINRERKWVEAFFTTGKWTGSTTGTDLVGGVDFAESQFNRAIQARRQPGSAFKRSSCSTVRSKPARSFDTCGGAWWLANAQSKLKHCS